MKSIYALILLLGWLAAAVLVPDFFLTPLRAVPGKLEQLLDAARAYRSEAKGNVMLMRHVGQHDTLAGPVGDCRNMTAQHSCAGDTGSKLAKNRSIFTFMRIFVTRVHSLFRSWV